MCVHDISGSCDRSTVIFTLGDTLRPLLWARGWHMQITRGDLSASNLNASLADVAVAYKAMVSVRNFLSAVLLGDAFFASAVPVPQYDISAALDEPFVETDRLPEVSRIWRDETEKRDDWGDASELDPYYPSP